MNNTVCALPDFNNISLHALRLGSRNLISSLLNPLKVIPNDNGVPRDWRGLAHLVGLKAEKIPVISFDNDPTAKVLHIWQKQQNPPCTIGQLRLFLATLDRFDVVDDTKELIGTKVNIERNKFQYAIFPDSDILNYVHEPEKTVTVSPIIDTDRDIITRDDVNGIIQNYDAFVVFADEDIDFATELIDTMEKQYGFKLCVKERDLVAGLPFEHKAIIQLISERCNRLIVIISPAYLKSYVNKFVVNYAQALGIEQGVRKIIPCLYEECDIPRELKHIFLLNYTRQGKLFNFWEKLRDSIQISKTPSPRPNTPRPLSQLINTNREILPDLKPALVYSQQLKPKKDGVKFGSCSNLTFLEQNETKRSVSINALHSESSSSNMNQNPDNKEIKTKKKINIITRIKHFTKRDKSPETVEATKKKKKFSLFKHKIKVPVLN